MDGVHMSLIACGLERLSCMHNLQEIRLRSQIKGGTVLQCVMHDGNMTVVGGIFDF